MNCCEVFSLIPKDSPPSTRAHRSFFFTLNVCPQASYLGSVALRSLLRCMGETPGLDNVWCSTAFPTKTGLICRLCFHYSIMKYWATTHSQSQIPFSSDWEIVQHLDILISCCMYKCTEVFFHQPS